jgi:hypothetical protein
MFHAQPDHGENLTISPAKLKVNFAKYANLNLPMLMKNSLSRCLSYSATYNLLNCSRNLAASHSTCQKTFPTDNLYLEQIGSPLRINLNLEDDKLQILTSGTGAPDYDACSSGQQRRIDLCLLLAMSHVAAEVGTLPQSAPLFIDEAFDTLDESGREALVQLALVLSETRQVFLVSHVDPQLPSTTSLRRIHLE